MTPEQGKRALRKLYGDKFGYRVDEDAPKAEEREQIRATLPELRDAKTAAAAARDARRAALLEDPEYRRLVAEANTAEKAHRDAVSRSGWFRVRVGRCSALFFEVTGEGDNWHEAVEAARAKAGRS